MKQLKKRMVSMMLILLLLVTAIPAMPVEVQAAAPGRVTGFSAVYMQGKTKLSWKKARGAKKYEIYRSTNGKTFKKVKTVKTRSWKDTKKGELWYKVRAVNGKSKGAFSAAKSVYTLRGWIPFRVQGNSFISAGTSIFPIALWNDGGKKVSFIGNSKDGRNMKTHPIMVYNKQTGQFEKTVFTNQSYYAGALCNAAGETNIRTHILKRKGKYKIYIAGLGMIYPYVNAYDDSSKYAYYIITYFKVGGRKYSLTVSNEPTAKKDYMVQRVK